LPIMPTHVLHHPIRTISRFIVVSEEEGPAGGFEETVTSTLDDYFQQTHRNHPFWIEVPHELF
jgi:hypothetical protein